MSNLSMIESPFLCLSPHHSVDTVCSPFLNLAVSATFLALHDLSFSCRVFCRVPRSSSPQQTRPYGFLQCVPFFSTKKAMGKSRIGAELLVSIMHISTTANFSLHCSVSVPARNQGISCFCVELCVELGVSDVQSHFFETGGEVLLCLFQRERPAIYAESRNLFLSFPTSCLVSLGLSPPAKCTPEGFPIAAWAILLLS